MHGIVGQIQAVVVRLKRIFWVNFLFNVFARFGRDNGGLLAAGLAFFLVLAFVPLLLVGLWFLGHLYAGKPDEALHQIQANILPQIIPGGGAGDEVTHLMERAGIASADGQHAGPGLTKLLNGHGVAGLLGLLTAVWAAIQIFINGSSAMNAAWETTEKRNWFVLRLIALGLLVATGVLLVGSLVATGVSTHLSNTDFAKSFPFVGALQSGGIELIAVAVSTVMYAVVYKFLPSAKVSWKAAFAGAVFSSVTWEIAKKALAVYLLRPNHGLYGNLGNLIVFILWVLYSMTILLLGAEVSAAYAEVVEGAPVARLKRSARHDARRRRRHAFQLGPGPRQGARPRPPPPQDGPEGRRASRAAVDCKCLRQLSTQAWCAAQRLRVVGAWLATPFLLTPILPRPFLPHRAPLHLPIIRAGAFFTSPDLEWEPAWGTLKKMCNFLGPPGSHAGRRQDMTRDTKRCKTSRPC